jgi:hypothetical protein
LTPPSPLSRFLNALVALLLLLGLSPLWTCTRRCFNSHQLFRRLIL